MCKQKYCLVRFIEDGILYIVMSKSITPIEGGLLWAPYKRLGFYEAVAVEYSDDRKALEIKLQDILKKEKTSFQTEKPCTSSKNDFHEFDTHQSHHDLFEISKDQEITYISTNADIEAINKTEKPNTSSKNDFQEFDTHQSHHDLFEISKDQEITYISTNADIEAINKTQKPGTSSTNSFDEFDTHQSYHDTSRLSEISKNITYISNNANIDRISRTEPKKCVNSSHEDFSFNDTFEMQSFENIQNLSDSFDQHADVNCNPKNIGTGEKGLFATPPAFKTPDLNFKNLTLLSSRNTKKHFCKFCFKLQSKFARHLENKHKDQNEVEEFLRLPKKSCSRLKLIEKIRVAGDFLYNTQKQYNVDGSLIVVRRPTVSKARNAEHYKPCGNCGGMYSYLSLVAHYRNCKKDRQKGTRDILLSSRKMSLVDSEASHILRNNIFPSFREDQISESVMTDKIIILFGNRLCQKYRSPHFYKMIRAKMRCVARFLATFREVCQISSMKFEHIFDPSHYDTCVVAINRMCGLNQKTGRYSSPATAFAIGSYLKKISFYLIAEYIKAKDKQRQEEVKDFLVLLQEGLTHDIYKTVQENQQECKRNKKIMLPSSNDIQCLRMYLEKRQKMFIDKLNKTFQYQHWKELLSLTLISLQLFNRRRAGEMERVHISDFMNYEQLQSDDEMLINLDPKEKKKIKHYVRFLIRGKLNRGVPVMVNKLNLLALELLISKRNEAKVPADNKYLFGIPGSSQGHLSASNLMNRYSKLCGAQRPTTLRGTELRKHIATKCGTMNLGKTGTKDVAEYLGHHEKIHLEHYRLPNAVKDIVRMSNILEKAQGNDDDSCSDQMNDSNLSLSIDNENEGNSANIGNNSPQNFSDMKQTTKHRISWSAEEKIKVNEGFQYYIQNFEMPNTTECNSFLEQQDLNRSIGQLRGYISNQIQYKKKEILHQSQVTQLKKVNRTRWTADEKKEVFKIFKNEIFNRALPTAAYCKEVIAKNNILQKRTGEMLRAFIYNQFKKKNPPE